MNSSAQEFVPISPEILYFGSPVAVISSLNPDGSTNLAAMSSFWALGDRFVLGLTRHGQTAANLERTPECVLNIPSPEQWELVERLGHTSGNRELTAYHRDAGITYAADKFAVSGFTPMRSECVAPLRAAECPVHVEAAVVSLHNARDRPAVYAEIQKLRVHAQRRILQAAGTRIDIASWSPLLYVFRHYYGKGSILGRSFRAKDAATEAVSDVATEAAAAAE